MAKQVLAFVDKDDASPLFVMLAALRCHIRPTPLPDSEGALGMSVRLYGQWEVFDIRSFIGVKSNSSMKNDVRCYEDNDRLIASVVRIIRQLFRNLMPDVCR